MGLQEGKTEAFLGHLRRSPAFPEAFAEVLPWTFPSYCAIGRDLSWGFGQGSG